MIEIVRQPHAVLDTVSRRRKGLKIERLLGLAARTGPLRMLEVGTGSGAIAHYFASHPTLECEVRAVDVVDQRLEHGGYAFEHVTGTKLPFHDHSFDIVISNHVIEHVGDASSQTAHLRELARVLRKDGLGYLAVPNRWMVVEPHYRLPFLSWLPGSLRSHYVRLAGKGDFYDCEPLTPARAQRMFEAVGLEWTNVCIDALRLSLDIEPNPGVQARLVAGLSDRSLAMLLPVFPTLCYRLAHGDGMAA